MYGVGSKKKPHPQFVTWQRMVRLMGVERQVQGVHINKRFGVSHTQPNSHGGRHTQGFKEIVHKQKLKRCE